MTSNGLAIREEQRSALSLTGSVQITSMAEVFRLAEALSNARGFVPKNLLGDPNGIAAAILTGLELGLGPMEAMRSIHMVEGKPTMSADLMLARALRAGIRIDWEQCDEHAAVLRLERGSMKHRQPFTRADAERAGLWGKSNWAKYPAAMLRARCVAAAMRAFCPDVLGSQVYTADELDSPSEPFETPRTVEVVQHAPQSQPQQQTQERRPVQLGEVRDELELREWCASNRDSLSRLANGRRADAQRKVADAAERCGVDDMEALRWAGLADEAE